MSAALIAVLVQIGTTTTPIPAMNNAQASISVDVTDSAGVPQSAVVLTGIETPPWSFKTSVRPGIGSVTATAIDQAGIIMGIPLTVQFSINPSVTVPLPPTATYQAPTGITVTPI